MSLTGSATHNGGVFHDDGRICGRGLRDIMISSLLLEHTGSVEHRRFAHRVARRSGRRQPGDARTRRVREGGGDQWARKQEPAAYTAAGTRIRASSSVTGTATSGDSTSMRGSQRMVHDGFLRRFTL